MEIFIETPKNLELESATWSDYKYHNTLNFLVCVAPNAAITFISKTYMKRIGNEATAVESEFLDTIPGYSNIMAVKVSILLMTVFLVT